MRAITLSRDNALAVVLIDIAPWQGCKIPAFGLSYNEVKELCLSLRKEISRIECHACGRPLPDGATNG